MGVAWSMAAAGLTAAVGSTNAHVENDAVNGMEHKMGDGKNTHLKSSHTANAYGGYWMKKKGSRG